MFNRKNIVILISAVLIYLFFTKGKTFTPAEDLGIPSAIGIDIISNGRSDVEFSVPISVYNFHTHPEVSDTIQTGTGKSLAETRETRQILSDHKFILGIERVVVSSENFARHSIESWIDIQFNNPKINDTSIAAVCKGMSSDIFKHKVPGYGSIGEYLEGILMRSVEMNFFSDNYKMMDIYVRLKAEGRNVILPYIEIKDKNLQITGMALFKKDKMVRKIDICETRLMNILRENNVMGILTLQESPTKYINYYGRTTKKVSVEKKKDKYTFNIDVSLIGDILNNSMYPNINNDSKKIELFQSNLSNHLKKECECFIERMQQVYKLDCLELGRIAAAKYGRGTGVDWNKIISDSEKTTIKINVDVKVDKLGRGDY